LAVIVAEPPRSFRASNLQYLDIKVLSEGPWNNLDAKLVDPGLDPGLVCALA